MASGSDPDAPAAEAGRVRLAFVQMLGARAVAIAATVVSFATLGRLLDPAAFGNFALAFAVFGVLNSVANFGLRQFLVRQPEPPDEITIATATGMQALAAGAGFAGCLALWATGGAGLMAPEAALALAILGAALLTVPVLTATEVALHRELAFRRPAIGAAGQAIADTAIAIALALAGFGAAAMATGFLAGQIVQSLVLVAGLRGRHLHRPRLDRREIPALLRFGGRLAGINNLPSLANLVAISALGGFAGTAAVGLYNRARVVRDLVERTLLQGVEPTVLPAMAAALRSGTPPGRLLATKYDLLATICWPAFLGIALLAEPLVIVLLGRDWLDAVAAVRVLAIGGAALPFVAMSVKFFTAVDALPAYLRIQAVSQALLAALCTLGALHSLEAFCLAISAAALVKAVQIVSWLRRHGISGGAEARRVLLRAAGITLVTSLGPALLALPGLAWSDAPPLVLLGLGIGWAAATWAGLLVLSDHALPDHLRQILRPGSP